MIRQRRVQSTNLVIERARFLDELTGELQRGFNNHAWVHDGYAVQTNIVNKDGKRACLLTVLKERGSKP